MQEAASGRRKCRDDECEANIYNETYTEESDPLEPYMNLNSQHRTEMYDRIHFAVMAIEGGARGMRISGRKMHDRLKAQNLIHERLLGRYDDLHTQSFEWVVDDTVTSLKNWEAGE